MAEDGKEAGHGASASVPDEVPASIPASPTAPTTEWTASDARGPLNAAPPMREAGAAPHTGPGVGESVEDEAMADERPVTPPNATEAVADDDRSVAAAPRPGRWPIAAGLVIGALIGAGSAYAVYATNPSSVGGASDRTVAALSDRVGALETRVAQMTDRGGEQASITDLKKRVSAIEAAGKASSDAAASPAGPSPAADLAPLRDQLSALQQSVSALKQQTPPAADLQAAQSKIAGLETALQGVRSQAAAAQSGVDAMRASQQDLTRTASAPALAVVADSLIQQIRRGLPFTAQVSALDALGVEPGSVAVLRQSADHGVPSAAALAAKFEPLTGDFLAATRRPTGNVGFWDRMKDDAANLVSVHRSDDLSGGDVPSLIARIKADLARDDVSAALATWQDLPADARARPQAAAWAALAKTHAVAMAAAQAIQTQAIAMLGAKKS